jgi:hypothetical protein
LSQSCSPKKRLQNRTEYCADTSLIHNLIDTFPGI